MSKTPFLQTSALTLITALILPSVASAQTAQHGNPVETITVVSNKAQADKIAGSISFLPTEELAKQDYTDITRVLRAVPGVNLQEEDGYGLRPNIGMRGSGADRSSKIVILEDGVLMAPAPYSAPAAYYFPSTARMSAIEVTKGPATVKYGPNTTAGAINLVSTPIPDDFSGHGEIMVSDLNRVTAHGWLGNRIDVGAFDLGFLIETYQDETSGFKTLPQQAYRNGGGDTGFETQDYVAKIGAYSHDGRQSLELKFQTQDEISNETYVGLSQADFNADPNQRYAASALDNFKGDHKTYQLTHTIDLTDTWSLTTVAYRTEFARNWQKLDKFDNSALSGSGDCNSIDEILRSPVLCASEYEVLVGADGYTSPDDVLGIRENNRSYEAQGVQVALAGMAQLAGLDHELNVSVRLHEDSVDRFQEQDQYRIENGVIVKTTDNAPGTQANRLSDAEAVSAYIQDRVRIGDLTVTAGLRVEDVKTQQDRWATPDRALAPSSQRSNDYTETLPSLAALYDVNDELALYGGVHRGFSAAPVSSRESADPEESTVYEGGIRYRGQSGFDAEATLFLNDYNNLLGQCTNSASGSNCDIGDAFNAGEVKVSGLELTASYDAAQIIDTRLSLPVSLAYSYTQTEIESTFADSFWGDVVAGDELPYVPENQLTLAAAVESDRWAINASLSAVSEMRNVAGQGNIPMDERIDAHTTLDLSARYNLSDAVAVKVKVENIADEVYIAARRPYGLRPGKPREVSVGISADF